METKRRVLGRQEGLSLIELLVVVAIMGILATLTAVAVTGTTTTSKGTSKTSDQAVVSSAEEAYLAEGGRHPTLDGCLPGEKLITLTLTCSSPGTADQQFVVDETLVGVDIDGDGSITGDSTVVPILWDQFLGDTADSSDKKFTEFVNIPAHAFDTIRTTADWKSGKTSARTEDGALIRSPDMTKCKGFNQTAEASGDLEDCPVWVLNEFGDAKALLPDTRY